MTTVALAIFAQESHSFVPGRTDMASFTDTASGIQRGSAVFSPGKERTLDGFIEAAAAHGVELVPIIAAKASSGPIVTDDAYESIVAEILAGIEGGDFDGVLLGLHGAMITESFEDAEGELMRRVRELVGPDIPIASSHDLHTHMTPLMAESADIIVGFQTCPHVDLHRTGRVAADLLFRTIAGEIRPRISFRKIPMMSSSETHDDRVFPNNQLIAKLHEAETHPRILSASSFQTQPWFDVSELGWTMVVVTDDDADLGQTTADDIARFAWSMREHYRVPKMDVNEAIETALAGEGVYALSEGSDSTTGGGLGDGNLLLKALLERGVDQPAFCMVVDAAAAAACAEAGIGGTVTVSLGGSRNPLYTPVEVTGVVTRLSDGNYTRIYGGVGPATMGLTAVLQVGAISIMIPAGKPGMVDYQAYLSVGLDPRSAKIVQPKSAGAYREHYEPIATCIDLDLPGPCTSDLPSLPFTRIPRPMWPWDEFEWDPAN